MGLILDTSVAVRFERSNRSVAHLVEGVLAIAGPQQSALSAVGLTEFVHGVHRADTAERSTRRRVFLDDLLHAFEVYPYDRSAALIAGAIDADQQRQGVTIPFADLLIGATALSLGFAVLTANVRHFRLIPGLRVLPFDFVRPEELQ